MAAILKLRRGTTTPTLLESELFFNSSNNTLIVGQSSGTHTLVKIGENTGSVSFSGDISGSNLYLSGDITAQDISARDVVLSGNIFLGDGVGGDIVKVNSSFSGSLLPETTDVYNIGSNLFKYKELHVISASIQNVTLDGTGIVSGSSQIDVNSTQNFQPFSSSVDSQLNSLQSYTQSNDQRVDSIESFTQSVDLRVVDLESTGSDHESRVDLLESTASLHENRIDSIETFTQSIDLRVDDLETFSASLDAEFLNTNGDSVVSSSQQISDYNTFLEINGDSVVSGSSQIDVNSTQNFQTFSSSVDLRLDNSESTGSDHESRIGVIETTFSSSVDSRLDLLENFSSSEYQSDSSSFDNRITDLRNVTGSYATTGSNIFIGNQTITGSVIGSGSVSFNSIPWPAVGNESHLFKTDGYVGEFASGNRNYSYLGVALEQVATASYYENSLLIYTYDDHDNPTYGSELNVGPLRNHMRVLPSGSLHYGNISIQDNEYGGTLGLFIADEIQIGYYTGSVIHIGNPNSNVLLHAPISSSTYISASEFSGDGSRLTNVTASYVEYTNIVNKPTLVSGSSQIDVNSTQNFQTFSGSVDIRLNSLENDFSTSVDQQLSSIHLYTSSLKNSIDVSGTDLTVYGNLTVQGTTTTLNTNDLIVEDKLVAIASGSTTSAESDGAGLFISGANASMLWDDSNSNIVFNQKVSSSVGFKGDGSEITGVTAANVEYADVLNKPTLISGSDQVTQSLDTRYLEINGDNVFTSSAQVNADTIANFDSNVKDKLNTETVISGSVQVDLTSTTNYISGIKTRLNAEGVLSGSAQLTTEFDSRYLNTNGDSVVSGSDQVTQSLDTRYLEINGDSVVSGSSQIDLTQTTNYSSGIKTRLDSEGVFSSSIQVNADTITNFDSNVRDVLIQDVVHSGSYLGTATTSNLTEGINLYWTEDRFSASLDSRGVISGSTQITNGSDIVSSSQQVSNYGIFAELNGDNLVSGSSQVDITQTTNYSTFSSSLDGRLVSVEGDQHTHSNKFYLDSIDQHLSTADIPEFSNVSLTAVNTFGSGELQAVFSGSTGVLGVRSLGTAAFVHYSQSIANGDPNVIGTAAAVKNYLDEQLVIIGAGDITEVLSGDGMSGGGLSGSVTLTLDTASAHFTNGVSTSINTFSSSVDSRLGDLEIFSSSLDDSFVTELELGIATGALENSIATKLDTGSYNTDSQSFDSRIVVLEGDTHENPLTFSDSPTIDFTRVGDSISAKAIGGIVSSSAQISGYGLFAELGGDNLVSSSTQISNYGIFAELNGDNLVSGSSQIDVNSTQNFQAFSQSVDLRLDNQESFSSSIDTTIKTKLNVEGVISGSSQILGGSGIVSSSTQIDNLGFLQVNGDSVVSGSDQLTGSLVDIASAQSISGTKTFQDIIVNGTGSFAYITSITGSSKIIGDAFVVVNNDTPSSRYAGLSVYDSGSANTTASFFFDGQTNDWNYEYNVGGTVDYGVAIFGPEYTTKGSPTYLTTNTIPKAEGNHHLNDSNITDNGTLITLGSNTVVGGTLVATGTTLVSGSSQITLGGDVTGTANANTVGKIQGVAITSGEATQLANINTTTISTTQWGYVGALNQGLTQTSNVTFGIISGSSIHSEGTITAEGDVVAYSTSDERLKDQITPIENSLEKISQIGGYSFVWNEKQDIYKGKDYGVIAQEIENILPELVETRDNGYKAVKYDRIVSLLIEGVKELSKEVSELKQKLG